MLTFGWLHTRPSGSVLPGSPRTCQEPVVVKAGPRAGGLSPLPDLPISVSMSLLETQRGERGKDCETQKGNPSISQPQPAPCEPPKAEGCFPGLLVSPAESQRPFQPFLPPAARACSLPASVVVMTMAHTQKGS